MTNNYVSPKTMAQKFSLVDGWTHSAQFQTYLNNSICRLYLSGQPKCKHERETKLKNTYIANFRKNQHNNAIRLTDNPTTLKGKANISVIFFFLGGGLKAIFCSSKILIKI